MIRSILIAILLTAAASVAQQRSDHAERQDTQRVDRVIADDVVVLSPSGDAYEALDSTVEWDEGDEVIVRDDTIVNRDKDNDAADVIPTDASDE